MLNLAMISCLTIASALTAAAEADGLAIQMSLVASRRRRLLLEPRVG
jgi:hypothetical protein